MGHEQHFKFQNKMQVLTAGNRERKGVNILSAYKRNDSTAGESFAVVKDAHFRTDVFSVSAKL